MDTVVFHDSLPLNITVVLYTYSLLRDYVFVLWVCWRSLRLIRVWSYLGLRDEFASKCVQILLAVKECVRKNDRGWRLWWRLVGLRYEACCLDEDADMELVEAGRGAKAETTAMVSINHLIFKIFNLFVCLFVCTLVVMSHVWNTDQYLNQFHTASSRMGKINHQLQFRKPISHA